MTILSSNGLSLPMKIGNKAAFQQARLLSRQALTRAYFINKRSCLSQHSMHKRITYTEWPIINFSIDKALSNLTSRNKS